jgi:hypothetical protein
MTGENEEEELQTSPEYTIVSAIDDSCVLFAVKETAAGHHNAQESGDSMLQQSPV